MDSWMRRAASLAVMAAAPAVRQINAGSVCDPTVVSPRQNDDQVLAVTCRTEPSIDCA